MADSLLLSCPEHQIALSADSDDPGRLFCPMGACANEVRIGAAGGFPFSPLSQLEQSAAQHHELVLAHEAAGFSRPEAMQVLCCIIHAGIMRGSGNG